MDLAMLEASIEAHRRAEVASLDAANEAFRLTDVAALVEAQRLADVATQKRLAKVATLEVARLADLAALRTRRTFWPYRAAARVVPATAGAAGASSMTGSHLAPRGLLGLGLVLMSGMCAASATGLGRRITESRRRKKSEEIDCRAVRDVISGWGKRLVAEASTFGWLMVKEHIYSDPRRTPFLVPGPLANALQLKRLEELAKSDCAAYEAYISSVYGGTRNITDARHEDDIGLSSLDSIGPDERGEQAFYDPVTAPMRETYNPAMTSWSVAAYDRPEINLNVGRDLQERDRRVLPAALEFRLHEQHRPIAHPPYATSIAHPPYASSGPAADYGREQHRPIARPPYATSGPAADYGRGLPKTADYAPLGDYGITLQVPFVGESCAVGESCPDAGIFFFHLPSDR
ncbi:hypothetical protein M885DRAFT_579682 [Pelagophyceae sp. CCMP2097]|nr:hypothetical protein M885DRAFT_579682 [Pelagophyceae sp. CCMP2097]